MENELKNESCNELLLELVNILVMFLQHLFLHFTFSRPIGGSGERPQKTLICAKVLEFNLLVPI